MIVISGGGNKKAQRLAELLGNSSQYVSKMYQFLVSNCNLLKYYKVTGGGGGN